MLVRCNAGGSCVGGDVVGVVALQKRVAPQANAPQTSSQKSSVELPWKASDSRNIVLYFFLVFGSFFFFTSVESREERKLREQKVRLPRSLWCVKRKSEMGENHSVRRGAVICYSPLLGNRRFLGEVWSTLNGQG